MALITYADKQAMGTQPTIPDVNKVTDNDMNEIKQAINNSTSYSTTEEVVGTWIDGKPIYRKVINFGALPNSTTKKVEHSLNNLELITNINGIAYNSTSNIFIPLPYLNIYTLGVGFQLYSDLTYIYITTSGDGSVYSESYVVLEYTKTTD